MGSGLNQWVKTKSDEAAVDAGCTFDIGRADRVRRFFARNLRASKGFAAGRPVELLDWQWRDLIAPAYGWLMPDGTRRFRHVECFLPKKNGKSFLMSGVQLHALCADDEAGSEVYAAAGDREQAKIVFKEALEMAKASPELSKWLVPRPSRNTILYPRGRGEYRALSSESGTKEGLNIHSLVCDEIHAWPNGELWDVLRYGGAARRQPLFWKISTAGIKDETSFWWRVWQRVKGILAGTVVDISTLAVWYGAEDGDDWTQESTWRKANPSYGTALNARAFEDDLRLARGSGVEENKFKRYRCNVPVTAESKWIGREYWEACQWRRPDEPSSG